MSRNEARESWDLMPGLGVGPLRFGMNQSDVAAVLGAKGRRVADGPYGQEDFPDGVKVFYDDGRLACVAFDAISGPQILLSSFELAGRNSAEAQKFLFDFASEHELSVLYTSDGSLALTEMEVLLRSQWIHGAQVSRPLIVKEEWLDSDYYRDRLPLEGEPLPRDPA
ncbi:hypothetical protein ABZ695_16350 [Streptomyces sp. NPDC006976]|uniref:hypothetical protein n=1 Tax=Streptomyces sp. NPDC006976 TaxID=3154311 RepID=UPI0033D6CF59